ncbi:Uncharacterized protein TCAP_00367 [Tolypocladium capitatum]|uniref:Uncharacterized protein n=1 Tax=Tolypocladium capitatum TaxID=45235 RepID=A0A2K3QQB3_9HYPO|nr:Uncharacterized protein TCAP_00367 [Tolypocladium capitatum]
MARTKEDSKADKPDRADKPDKADKANTADKATAEAPPRGRGRPKKGTKVDSGAVKKAYVSTGRPRGRPKSDNPKTKVYVPTGRPRGRPPGSGKKKRGPVAKANGAATPQGTSGPGKRGRPRKSDAGEAAAAAAAAAATPTTKGKRGRPASKKSLEPEADQDEDVEVDGDTEPEPVSDDGSDDVEDVADGATDDDEHLAAEPGENEARTAGDGNVIRTLLTRERERRHKGNLRRGRGAGRLLGYTRLVWDGPIGCTSTGAMHCTICRLLFFRVVLFIHTTMFFTPWPWPAALHVTGPCPHSLLHASNSSSRCSFSRLNWLPKFRPHRQHTRSRRR